MNPTNNIRKRFIYAMIFLTLLIIETMIALFVHDNFVRPYVGDIIVIAVIHCFIRIFVPNKVKLMPLYVFLFAIAVEIAQYFDYVTLLGLGDIDFFRILLGNSFAVLDIYCYAAGALVCFGVEYLCRGVKKSN